MTVLTSILTVLAGMLIFGAAGVCGAMAGMAILPKLKRFDDGPAPVDVNPIALVAGAAVLGGILAYRHVSPQSFIVAALASVALVAIWYCDARTGIVPDLFSLVPLAILTLYAVTQHAWQAPISAVVLFVPFGAAALLSRGRGMGWGDAKLAALGGALLGMFVATLAFGVTSLAAVVVASIRNRSNPVPIAFAPYLVAATALGIAFTAR